MSEDAPAEPEGETTDESEIELSEEHVGKPVVSPETYVVGTVTGVNDVAYTVRQETDGELDFLSVGLLDSGDGQLAVLPDQIDHIDEDGIYLK